MKSLLTCGFFFCYFVCLADNTPITGNTSVQPGSTETYTVNWEFWGSVWENHANVTWSVTGGTLLSSDKHTATIQWDVIPTWLNGYGFLEVYEDLGSQGGNLGIDIVNFVTGTSEYCNDVLGPSVIAENFGQGNNQIGPPLPNGVTTYTYQAFCALIHDEYTRINSLISCRSDWHDIPNDHTGNNGGYFLLVDGSNDPGEFYRATISGLTNAFRYQFSVWGGNFDKPSVRDNFPNQYTDPRIIFQIRDVNDDHIIQSSNIIELPLNNTFTWQQISFMFDIPPGVTSVRLVILTKNGGEVGNDVALDDIAFAPCYPPIIASFTPNPTFTTKSYTCDNGTVTFHSWWPTPSPPYANAGFQWQRSTDNGNSWADIAGATSMSYTRTETTANKYYYRIKAYDATNPSQFVLSNNIIFFVQKLVVDPKNFYVSGCVSAPTLLNPTFNLQNSDPYGPPLSFNYTWSPATFLNNYQIQNPTITLPALPPPNPPFPPNPIPPVNYFYNLTIQNTNFGCVGSNTQTVAHINPRKVALVNAFTPNNDGFNDYFRPTNIQDYTNFGAEFSIYNRWGQLIFYRNSGLTLLDWSWDGKVNGVPQDANNFVYTLRIPGCPNNYLACPSCNVNPPTSNNNYTISGNFVLIR